MSGPLLDENFESVEVDMQEYAWVAVPPTRGFQNVYDLVEKKAWHVLGRHVPILLKRIEDSDTRILKLEAALKQYADRRNWTVDNYDDGCRDRIIVWTETTEGYELAKEALKENSNE